MPEPHLILRVIVWALVWAFLISGARAQIRPCGGEVGAIVEDEAVKAGLDPRQMRVICQIESGGDRTAATGSYKGIFQLSDATFRRLGGTGSILDARENSRVAMKLFRENSAAFREANGRELDATELYLSLQQGLGGLSAHLAEPNRLAWHSMFSTGEGQQRGSAWSKLAIWGNVPTDARAQFGDVEHITSGQFVEVWRMKVEGPPTRQCLMPDGLIGRMR